MDRILGGHLLLSIVFLTISFFFKIRQPTKINSIIGYRTPMSMKNEETWREANQYSAKIQFRAAILFCISSIPSYFLVGGMSSFYISSALLVVVSLSVIPLTEYHLRKLFDKNGARVH